MLRKTQLPTTTTTAVVRVFINVAARNGLVVATHLKASKNIPKNIIV
jgi:hypothetical protein